MEVPQYYLTVWTFGTPHSRQSGLFLRLVTRAAQAEMWAVTYNQPAQPVSPFQPDRLLPPGQDNPRDSTYTRTVRRLGWNMNLVYCAAPVNDRITVHYALFLPPVGISFQQLTRLSMYISLCKYQCCGSKKNQESTGSGFFIHKKTPVIQISRYQKKNSFQFFYIQFQSKS